MEEDFSAMEGRGGAAEGAEERGGMGSEEKSRDIFDGARRWLREKETG